MSSAAGDPGDLRRVKRDAGARRIVAEWRRLASTGMGARGVEARGAGAGSGAGGPVTGRERPGLTLVGCSGGADSSALVLALAASEPERLVVAHIVHDLRASEEAEADRDFVRLLCARLGAPFVEGRVAVRGEGERGGGGNLEGAARRFRYAELERLAVRSEAAFVATAHQADDQLETLVMALVRGAGPRGMRGIASSRLIGRGGASAGGEGADEASAAGGGEGAVRRVRLIRPMLVVGREDSERICALAGVEWRVDHTNEDASRLRAALRRRVTPVLRELRPGAARRASSTARLMQQAQRIIDGETAELMHAASVSEASVSWPRRALAASPGLLIGEALRAAAGHLQGTRGRDRLTSGALRPVVRAVRDASTEPRRFDLRGVTVTVTTHTVTASKREGGFEAA